MVKTTVIATTFLILSALPGSAATIAFHTVREGPCKAEVERFCEHEKPGGGRIQACLREHVNRSLEALREGLARISQLFEPAPQIAPSRAS